MSDQVLKIELTQFQNGTFLAKAINGKSPYDGRYGYTEASAIANLRSKYRDWHDRPFEVHRKDVNHE